jgi:hypothetical protein
MSEASDTRQEDFARKALEMKIAAAKSKNARSIDEVALLYDSSRTAIKEEIRAGRLVARKFGRRTIILEQDEFAWANSLPRIQPSAAA